VANIFQQSRMEISEAELVRVRCRNGAVVDLGELAHLVTWCGMIRDALELCPDMCQEALPFDSFDEWQVLFVASLLECYDDSSPLHVACAGFVRQSRSSTGLDVPDAALDWLNSVRDVRLSWSWNLMKKWKSIQTLYRLVEHARKIPGLEDVPAIALYDSVWLLLEFLQCEERIMDEYVWFVQMSFFFRLQDDMIRRNTTSFKLGERHPMVRRLPASYGLSVSPNGQYLASVSCVFDNPGVDYARSAVINVYRIIGHSVQLCDTFRVCRMDHKDAFRRDVVLTWGEKGDVLAAWMTMDGFSVFFFVIERVVDGGSRMCEAKANEVVSIGEAREDRPHFVCFSVDVSRYTRAKCNYMWWSGDSQYLLIKLTNIQGYFVFVMWSMTLGLYLESPERASVGSFLQQATRCSGGSHHDMVPIGWPETRCSFMHMFDVSRASDRHVGSYGVSLLDRFMNSGIHFQQCIYVLSHKWALCSKDDVMGAHVAVFYCRSNFRIHAYACQRLDVGPSRYHRAVVAYCTGDTEVNKFTVQEEFLVTRFHVVIQSPLTMFVHNMTWSPCAKFLLLLARVHVETASVGDKLYCLLVYSLHDIRKCEVPAMSKVQTGILMPPIAATPVFRGCVDSMSISENGVIIACDSIRGVVRARVWNMNSLMTSASRWKEAMELSLSANRIRMRGLMNTDRV